MHAVDCGDQLNQFHHTMGGSIAEGAATPRALALLPPVDAPSYLPMHSSVLDVCLMSAPMLDPLPAPTLLHLQLKNSGAAHALYCITPSVLGTGMLCSV